MNMWKGVACPVYSVAHPNFPSLVKPFLLHILFTRVSPTFAINFCRAHTGDTRVASFCLDSHNVYFISCFNQPKPSLNNFPKHNNIPQMGDITVD